MLKNAQALTMYMVIAEQRINVPPAVFTASAALDSRTPITRLPLMTYGALRPLLGRG
jgi:hypothetical protein